LAIILAVSRVLRHPLAIAGTTAIAPLLQKSLDLHCMSEVMVGLRKYFAQEMS